MPSLVKLKLSVLTKVCLVYQLNSISLDPLKSSSYSIQQSYSGSITLQLITLYQKLCQKSIFHSLVLEVIYKVYFARVVLVARYIYENIPSQNLFIFPDAVLLTSLYDNAFFLRSGYKLFIIPIFFILYCTIGVRCESFQNCSGIVVHGVPCIGYRVKEMFTRIECEWVQ